MTPIWHSVGLWLLHSAVAGGLILVLTRALLAWPGQPALKQRLGEWGLLAALTAAGLSLLPAWLIVPWPWAAADAAPAPLATQAAPVAPDPGPPAPAAVVPDVVVIPQLPEVVPALPQPQHPAAGQPVVVAPPVVENRPGTTSVAAPASRSWLADELPSLSLAALVMAYSLGLVWCLGDLLRALWALRALVRGSVPAPPQVMSLFRELAGNGRRPRILMSYRLRSPLSFGLMRPTIVLPAALCAELPRTQLHWVLRHELTHLQRRDAWSGLLCAVARAVYFYLPWAWSVCRHVRLYQEYLADAAAVGADQLRADYAEFLLMLTRTAAPPLAATGVSGTSSDLYRRVTMLLKNHVDVQRRPRRRWLLPAGAALLAAAVVLSGVGFAVHASAQAKGQAEAPPAPAAKAPLPQVQNEGQPDPAQPQPPAQPLMDLQKLLDNLKIQMQPGGGFQPIQVQMPGFDDVQKAIQKLQGATTPDEMKAAQQELMKAVQKMQAQMPFGPNPLPGLPQVGGGWGGLKTVASGAHRLGVSLTPPDKTLVEQLDLPKGEGLVVNNVTPGSAADKAALKPNDILLKFDGKAVPNKTAEFNKMLEQTKAETPVDVVVLRKGKELTIKGVSLPKQAAAPANPFGGVFGPGGGMPAIGAGQGVQLNMIRTNDNFNCRYQEGTLIINVTGSVDKANKAQVESINVQDGAQVHDYKTVKDVPAQYKEKVNLIVDMVNKGTTQIQIQGN